MIITYFFFQDFASVAINNINQGNQLTISILQELQLTSCLKSCTPMDPSMFWILAKVACLGLSLTKSNSLTPKGLREPKRPFLILGRLPYVPKVFGVFETS
jgi:hypothetical protein